MTLDVAMDKYYNSLYTYIYGRCGKDKYFADECCNTVFMLFSEKGCKLEDRVVYPWLMRTATNKTKEYFRKKKKENSILYLDDITTIQSYDADLSDKIYTDEDIEIAKQKLLSLLSPKERELYECYFIQKMSYISIAKKFGIDRNTASKRLHAIEKMLRGEVNKMFAATGSAVIIRILAELFDR